jgi:hypothetical protein
MSDDRATVDLPKPVTGSRYSVRRATTASEREQSPLVEHVKTGPLRVRAPSMAEGTDVGMSPPPRWRVEVAEDRVILRGDGVQIELGADEARRLAETILRAR